MYKLLKTKHTKRLILHADPFQDRHSQDDKLPFWKGTVVGVDMTLDQTKEFSLLLKAIGETYSKEVRERKKAKYRKPRFV